MLKADESEPIVVRIFKIFLWLRRQTQFRMILSRFIVRFFFLWDVTVHTNNIELRNFIYGKYAVFHSSFKGDWLLRFFKYTYHTKNFKRYSKFLQHKSSAVLLSKHHAEVKFESPPGHFSFVINFVKEKEIFVSILSFLQWIDEV